MLTISIFPISFLSFSGKDVPRDGKLSCVDANDNGKIFCQWKIDHVIVTFFFFDEKCYCYLVVGATSLT
jgi:hypothetical protein